MPRCARPLRGLPPTGSFALRVLSLGALGVGAASCSLVFDGSELSDGAGTTSGGASTSAASTATGTTTGGGAGGDGEGAAPPSTTTTSGDGGGGAATTTSSSTGDGGAGGDAGGAPPCSPTFCESEGPDAEWCFDFDGPTPLAGAEIYEPDGETFTTTVEVVDAPTHSCSGAVSIRVEPTGPFTPTYAVLGRDLPAGNDHFVWSFWVHRVSTENPVWLAPTAIMNWTAAGDTGCQAFLFMRDDPTPLVRFYTQCHDGTSWVGTGEADVAPGHATIGAWTHVEMEVDLTSGVEELTLRVDGVGATFLAGAPIGPATDHYDVEVGSFYTEHGHATVYDDVTLRLLE